MTRRPEILSAIKRILSEKSLTARPVSELTEADALELDSVARLTLVVELENAFGAEIMDDEFDPAFLESMKAICDVVERKLGQGPSS